MANWESYALGAIGLALAAVSIAAQVAGLALGRPWSALPGAFGLVIGALLYRAGYRLLSR